ncbi:hypothetical protein ACIPJK_37710 [Streptomyces roseus]|uniref:hypothetical protein n=1 Tax=Streptomyces roseus TaxID=66430 RepID=UPI003801717E
MNSSTSNGFDHDGTAGTGAMCVPLPEGLDAMNATYAEMLDRAEADIALLQRAVKRRRKALRGHDRRRALARAAVYRRPALIAFGLSFFVVGVIMLSTDQPHAMDMFDRAMTAWSAALAVRPRP